MKHAYLIIAHNDFDILEKQLRLLDDPRNDFFIHIDKKVKDFPFDKFRGIPTCSRVYFIPQMDVRWGDFMQILCELELLKAATAGNYRYYHLLSGVDMPLKSNDEIHAFFAANEGKELVNTSIGADAVAAEDRVRRYHAMRLRRSKNLIVRLVGTALYLPVWILHKLGWQRKWDEDKKIAYGSNWFSITHELACYVLEQEPWIRKHFHHTCCADEVFLQTLLINSQFRERCYVPPGGEKANMRLIDWQRSNGRNPWIYRVEDMPMLLQSNCLFARKFSTQVDNCALEELYGYILEKNKKAL